MARNARERIDGDLVSAAVYGALLDELDGIGRFEVEEKLTSSHIVHGRAFLHGTEQVSASRWHHEVILGLIATAQDPAICAPALGDASDDARPVAVAFAPAAFR